MRGQGEADRLVGRGRVQEYGRTNQGPGYGDCQSLVRGRGHKVEVIIQPNALGRVSRLRMHTDLS